MYSSLQLNVVSMKSTNVVTDAPKQRVPIEHPIYNVWCVKMDAFAKRGISGLKIMVHASR